MSRRLTPDEVLGAPPGDGSRAAPSRILETLVLRFLACVVHADGVVEPRELALLERIAGTMHLGVEEARRILDDELARHSDAAALARQLPEPLHRRSVYALGCMMALSGGTIAPPEQAVLDDFARGAGITPAEAADVLAEVRDAEEE